MNTLNRFDGEDVVNRSDRWITTNGSVHFIDRFHRFHRFIDLMYVIELRNVDSIELKLNQNALIGFDSGFL